MGRIEANINIELESWLFGFRPFRDRGSLPYLNGQIVDRADIRIVNL